MALAEFRRSYAPTGTLRIALNFGNGVLIAAIIVSILLGILSVNDLAV